jgi:accessory gene regulator B
MLSEKAIQLSGRLASRGIISAEDVEVYSYGLELLMSTVLNILLVIVIAFLFSQPLAWFFFLLSFIPLRLTAGGFHAKTHLGCCLVFSVAYALLMLLGVLTAELVTPAMLIGVSAACVLVVLLLSPVQAPNKPLAEQDKRRNRRLSLVIAAVNLLATASSLVIGAGLIMPFVFLVLGQTGAAVSLIAAKLVHE